MCTGHCKTAAIITSGEVLSEQLCCDYVYVGNEFCERLLPTVEQLRDYSQWCNQHGRMLVLVTPYSTQTGIAHIKELIDYIEETFISCEIVVNDWGVLRILENSTLSCPFILGRILISQHIGKSNYVYCDVHTGHDNAAVEFANDFLDMLARRKIRAVEFNTYKHFVTTKAQLLRHGLKTHIHYPFSYLNTTRHCTAAGGYTSYMRDISASCSRECQKTYAQITDSSYSASLYIKGNAYMVKEKVEAIQLEEADRIILNDITFG